MTDQIRAKLEKLSQFPSDPHLSVAFDKKLKGYRFVFSDGAHVTYDCDKNEARYVVSPTHHGVPASDRYLQEVYSLVNNQ